MPMVADILADKGTRILTVTSSSSVLEAVRRMNQQRVGALVVVDEQHRLVGMFTERDVLRLVGALQDVSSIMIRDVMTREVITVTHETDVEEVSEMMRQRRVRHLPVLSERGDLIGLVSIGDINAFHVTHQARQLQGLNDYIHGRV
jgi:CBS domain-containing protein